MSSPIDSTTEAADDGPSTPRLLEDLLVLDLTRFLSGPYSTLLLAGLGAQVMKVDDPRSGDPTAGAPPFVGPSGVSFERATMDDYGAAYLKRARGKQSITINLKDEEGRALFLALVEHADVLVENFRPGVAERLGIPYSVLEERNPRLVYCALTGYGTSGPERDTKSFDLMAQAASGLMSITGDPEGAPMKIGSAFSDMVAGAYATAGILGALHERNRSGRGQAIDISMVDCLFTMIMDEPLDLYERLGLPLRQGNRVMRFAPFNAYEASDGWVTIGVATQRDWAALSTAMGQASLGTDENFRRVEWRLQNNAKVDRLVGGWVAAHSVAQILEALNGADVPCAPVRTPHDAMAWPQLLDRAMVEPLRQPDGTATEALAGGLPFTFSRSATGFAEPAPVPGADTKQVLKRYLGLSDSRLASLKADGTI